MILPTVYWGHSGCSVKPYHGHDLMMFDRDEFVYSTANNEGDKKSHHKTKLMTGLHLMALMGKNWPVLFSSVLISK